MTTTEKNTGTMIDPCDALRALGVSIDDLADDVRDREQGELVREALRAVLDGEELEVEIVDEDEEWETPTACHVSRFYRIGSVEYEQGENWMYGPGGLRPDEWAPEAVSSVELPERVEAMLRDHGVDTSIGVAEPPEPDQGRDVQEPPTHDQVCVYWDTACDGESGPVAYHADAEAARRDAEARSRRLRAKHPGPLLCGYDVRRWDSESGESGEWMMVEDD